MLFMISPWADSTDLACSVPDLDEQSCLEGKKAALGKEDCVELFSMHLGGRLLCLTRVTSGCAGGGFVLYCEQWVLMQCLVKPPAFYLLR